MTTPRPPALELRDAITAQNFAAVDIRVGVITDAQPFPEARKPAYQLRIDFGPALGERRSSAQITTHYQCSELIGRQVLGVVNLPPKRIGPFVSEVLVLGLPDAQGGIILITPDTPAPLGARLY